MSDDRVTQFPRRPRNEFEEFVAELKNLLGGMSKGKRRTNGNGSGGGGGGGKNQASALFGVAAIAFLALLGLTSFYTIDVSEEGVITRFGKYVETTQPGLHFKIPFWIDRVYKVKSRRIIQDEFGFRTVDQTTARSRFNKGDYKKESLMLTGDLNVADVEWVVQYRISNPYKFLFKARDVRRNIRDVSMSIMRRVVGDRLASDVLTIGRVEIASEAKKLMQDVLDHYDMGIHIEKLILQDVNPPDPVKPAFNEVNAAKQEQEQAINNAEGEYNRVIPEARGKAEQLLAESEAYAIAIKNRSKGDAAKFTAVLKEYKKAPEVTRRRLYLETMEEVFTRVEGFTIVDKDIKGLLPLYSISQGQKPLPQPKSE